VSEFDSSGIRRDINARISRPSSFQISKVRRLHISLLLVHLLIEKSVESDCIVSNHYPLNVMAHKWENVVMEDDDEEMEQYVLVTADQDVEDDFVLTETDRTVVDTDHVSPSPTAEGSMHLLDSLDIVPTDFPFEEALAFLGSTKLKGIWMLVLLVSIFLFNTVDFICGIRASQPWKPETETVPCPMPEEARTTEEVSAAGEVRQPKVSPLGHSLHPKMSATSQYSLDLADYHASECNESTLGIWEELKLPIPRMSNSGDESIPSIHYGSLTVWESRYQVQDVKPKVASFETAPMIPMIPWENHDASGYGHGLYPSTYPAVVSQESDGASPVNPPRIPMRSLIPYKTPEVPPPHRMNGASGRFSASHRPELYPSLLLMDLVPNHYRYIARHGSAGSDVASSPEAVEPRGSVALTQYTFQEFIRHHENVLVTFYLPCERFHQKYVPLWTNFTNSVLKSKLPLVTATVNCHSHPSICREQGCYKFPTIRWFRQGHVLVEDYNNGRNAQKLLLFAQETLVKPQNSTKTHETISYPTIQIMPPPTSHAKYGDDDINEVQGHLLPTIAFVKKQRTPVISSSTTASNSLALHHVRSASSPCPINSAATAPMIATPELNGIATSHHVEL
jgi:Thioredoxin